MSKHVLNTRLAFRRAFAGARREDSLVRFEHQIGAPAQQLRQGREASLMPAKPQPHAGEAQGPADVGPDDQAFGAAELDRLFRQRSGQLATALRGSTGDRDGVLDAIQEAFARLAGLSNERRQSLARPEAYLFRTGLNVLREWGRGAARASKAADAPELLPDCPDPMHVLESRDLLHRLEAAMLRLRPKTREIFLAHRLDGLSYAEIAERTGLSVKGVEKHMSKAIAAVDRAAGR